MTRSVEESERRERTVCRVEVDKLFGRYTYEIPTKPMLIDSELGVLYGVNGAGKTTILRIIHHMLSCSTERGHKTYLGQIHFRRIALHFSDGLELVASRGEDGDGTFEMKLLVGDKELSGVEFEVDGGAVHVRPGSRQDRAQDEFLEGVSEVLGLHSYLLADDRRLDSDVFPFPQEEVVRRYAERSMVAHRFIVGQDEDEASGASLQLELAMQRLSQWARSQALSSANLGSQNANSIYAGVVRQLSTTAPEAAESESASTSDMVAELKQLENRSAEHSRFALTSSLEVEELISALHSAPSHQHGLIVRLLQPYAEGIRARLDAQDELYRTLNVFTSILDRFLYDKSASFDLRGGLSVRTHDGVTLSPDRLSSGERQLITLLCNVISARQHASLFLIDEPELSLNVRWQRQLIPALLACAEGSAIQFILASHSIELLSQYKNRVLRLPSVDRG